MLKIISLILTLSLALTVLPAQADSASLLAKAQAANPTRYQFAVSKNAEIRYTNDNKSFTILWQPTGVTTPNGVIAMLHGHGSYAFDEFFLWQSYAEKRGYAIFALQWWFGGGEATSDYYTPTEIYPIFSSLLAEKGVASGGALLHGFSRGSANSYAVAAQEAIASKRYFGMVLSNSGGAAAYYPPNQEITAGAYGSQPYKDLKWIMYCGELDPDPTLSGCPGMNAARVWVTNYGASVVLFIDDPVGDHGGFMTNSSNVTNALLTYADFLASKYAPTCSLAASTPSISAGTSVTLSTTCGATASSYVWSKTGFASSASSGSVIPFYSTTYSVTGSNAIGTGKSTSFTVQVSDSAVLPSARANYTISKTSSGYTIKDNVGAGGTLIFSSLKRLRFSDSAIAFDLTGIPGQAYRLYQAAFDRVPDLDGLGYQMSAIEVSGLSPRQVAQNFINSPEFSSKYGALNDTQFVTQLYQNVLKRAPDSGGLAFYLEGLANQSFTRASILAGFSESPENQALVLPAIQNGIIYNPLYDSAGNGN